MSGSVRSGAAFFDGQHARRLARLGTPPVAYAAVVIHGVADLEGELLILGDHAADGGMPRFVL